MRLFILFIKGHYPYFSPYTEEIGRLVLANNANTIAVIDLGSNSIRLVVYRRQNDVWASVINEKAQLRLGEGVATTGKIQANKIRKTIDCLTRFKLLAAHAQASIILAIATSAVREADNGPEFCEAINGVLDKKLVVLSGPEEGRYAAKGVRWSIPNATGLVCDLGGSSLELAWLDAENEPSFSTSIAIGPLQLADMFGENRKKAKSYVDGKIKEALTSLRDSMTLPKPYKITAIGGAWRALASLQMRAEKHPLSIIHRYCPDKNAFLDFIRPISFYSNKQAMRLDINQIERRLTLPYAALILRRLMKWTQAESIEFCSAGIREGALALHLGKQTPRTHLEAVKSLVPEGGRFGPVGDAMNAWISPAIKANINPLQTITRERILEASHLADLGWNDHPSHKKYQAYSSILHSAVLPHDHIERAELAAIQYFRHKGRSADITALQISKLLSAEQQVGAKILGRLILLGMQICLGNPEILKESRLIFNQTSIDVLWPKHWAKLHATSIKNAASMLTDACGLAVKIKTF